jgi:hypothetical protein
MENFATVKISLKQRHPKGKMAHGRHWITPEPQVLNFNADELHDLKGQGPCHWFEFKVLKEMTKKTQKEIDEMKAQQQKEEQERLAAEQKKKEEEEFAELQRLENLEKEALLKQQLEEENKGNEEQ